MYTKKVSSLLLLSTMIIVPSIAFAAGPSNWFFTIINNLLYMVIWPVFVAISIAMFIWAGFLYLTAQGDASKITTANKALVVAVVGIIVVLLSFGYMNYLRTTLNSSGGGGGGGGGGGTSGACCITESNADSVSFVCVDAGGTDSCNSYGGSYKGDGTACTQPGIPTDLCEFQ